MQVNMKITKNQYIQALSAKGVLKDRSVELLNLLYGAPNCEATARQLAQQRLSPRQWLDWETRETYREAPRHRPSRAGTQQPRLVATCCARGASAGRLYVEDQKRTA